MEDTTKHKEAFSQKLWRNLGGGDTGMHTHKFLSPQVIRNCFQTIKKSLTFSEFPEFQNVFFLKIVHGIF